MSNFVIAYIFRHQDRIRELLRWKRIKNCFCDYKVKAMRTYYELDGEIIDFSASLAEFLEAQAAMDSAMQKIDTFTNFKDFIFVKHRQIKRNAVHLKMDVFTRMYKKCDAFLKQNSKVCQGENQTNWYQEKDDRFYRILTLMLEHSSMSKFSIKFKLFSRQKLFLNQFMQIKQIFIEYNQITGLKNLDQ
jgi:hypothetical protein